MNLTRYIEVAVLMGLVMVSGIVAYQRNIVWKDDLSLWSDVVKKSPNKARVYNAIGMYYYERQKPDGAIPFFQQGLYLQPGYAFAHNNLGLCFLAKGRINQAIEEFRHAIKGRHLNGMYHVNLGIAYLKKGWYELANREIKIGKTLRRKYPGKQ